MPKVFAVIPAFNEEKKISRVVRETKKYVDKVIVVDDGSLDKTSQLAEKAGAIVLKHQINMRKGTVLKTGCDAALELGADIITTIDGDGQHKPKDIPSLLKKLEDEKLDIVFASRLLGRQMPFMLKLGNKFLTYSSKFLYGVDIYDTQSGFRAFRADAYKQIRWVSQGYSAETEMIALVGKKKLKYGEVFIETIYHNPYKGTTMLDGMKIFLNMLVWKLLR